MAMKCYAQTLIELYDSFISIGFHCVETTVVVRGNFVIIINILSNNIYIYIRDASYLRVIIDLYI